MLVARDPTWKAVWIGVASTAFASGAVDASGIWETRRRERAVLAIVARKVRTIYQQFSLLIGAVFDEAAGQPPPLGARLRATTQASWDPTLPANIWPARLRRELVEDCARVIEAELNAAVELGLQTSHADRLVRLESAVDGAFLRTVIAARAVGVRDGMDVLGGQAADAFDVIEREWAFFRYATRDRSPKPNNWNPPTLLQRWRRYRDRPR